MKRFLWLFALPYMVMSSSVTRKEEYEMAYIKQVYWEVWYDYPHVIVDNFMSKDVAEDMAAALNEAHEHRILKKLIGDCPCEESSPPQCVCVPVK